MNSRFNRKLLVSVFDAQEAREALLGGGRIIDSEDPRSALGNIKPRQIMAVSNVVLQYKRGFDVQLSTNIGEDQLLFDRTEAEASRLSSRWGPRTYAVQKSSYEISGKAAQSAVGVALSMNTAVSPCNIVKVGVDGMNVDLVGGVLEEVVSTLKIMPQLHNVQVMSVLFAQDLTLWAERQNSDTVRNVLVGLGEYHPCRDDDEDGFDLIEYSVGTLRDGTGGAVFTDRSEVSLGALIRNGFLPAGLDHAKVKPNGLFPHSMFFPSTGETNRTSKAVIKAMVDASANAGVDSMMLDTRIQSKVARLCLVDTSKGNLSDINQFDVSGGLTRKGVLTLDEIRYFVEYCHYKKIEANVAGSVQSYQAQQLWLKIPELDQISTRGASSGVRVDPNGGSTGSDTREKRVIKRNLVSGIAPPEHGGVLNFPKSMKGDSDAMGEIKRLIEELSDLRRDQSLPDLKSYFIDRDGSRTPIA